MKKLLATLLCLLMLVGCGSGNNGSTSDSSSQDTQTATSQIDTDVKQLETYILADQLDEALQLVEKIKTDYAEETGSSADFTNKVIYDLNENTNSTDINAYDDKGTRKYFVSGKNSEDESYVNLYEFSYTTESDYQITKYDIAEYDGEISHRTVLDVYSNNEIVSSSQTYSDGSTFTCYYENGTIVKSEIGTAEGEKITSNYDENGNGVVTDDAVVEGASSAHNGIVGSWEMNHNEGASLYFVITFNEDGTGTIDIRPNGSVQPMTYELDGTTVIIHQDGMEDDTSITYDASTDEMFNYTRIN